MGLKFYLGIYVFGGLTFVPLVLLVIIGLLLWGSPKVHSDEVEGDEMESELDQFGVTHPEINYDDLKAGEFEEKLSSGVETYATGWLTVTTEFYQLSQYKDSGSNPANGSESPVEEPQNGDDEKSRSNSRYSQIYKLVKGDKNASKDSENETGKSLKNVRKKNRYFAVLKHGNLFLYKDDDCKNVQHVIVLNKSVVALWPRNLKEGELFSKRTAICIMKKEFSKDLKSSPTLQTLTDHSPDSPDPPPGSFFIYTDYNHEKEDWYFDLIKATKKTYLKKGTVEDVLEPSVYAQTSFFKTKDMMDLIQTLNSSEGQLTTKWLNALIGRVFLALHNTKEFHDLVKSRVEKKLMKIKKPGFLDDFQIEKINVGDSGPFITFPKLNSLSPEGLLEMEANLLYTGGLTIQIATKANINLGSRFKTREVNLDLTVKLVRLSGRLLVKMKPPPSNRIWYGFTSMPEMDLDVEPVVSSRQLTYNVVTKMITNKFKELIKESLVLPYMDEFPIYNTESEIFRGGIWDKSSRETRRSKKDTSPEKVNHRAETLANDELVSLNEHDDGEESYEKPPARSETVNFPVFQDRSSSLKYPASVSSGISGKSEIRKSVSSSDISPAKTPLLERIESNNDETSSGLKSPFIAAEPEIAPREDIPDVVEREAPTQTHQTRAVFIDKTLEQNSESTSKISKQMKKVFKNLNGSSDSVNSGSKEIPGTQNISGSIKKLGKWYSKVKDNRGVENVEDELGQKEKAMPEMIKFRRDKQNSFSSPRQVSELESYNSNVSSASMFKKKPSYEDFTALPKTPNSSFLPVDHSSPEVIAKQQQQQQQQPHRTLTRKAPPPSLPPRENTAGPALPPREEPTDVVESKPGMIEHRRGKSVNSTNQSIDNT